MLFSRKVSPLQVPEDVKFSKKISERFDPETIGDLHNPKLKIDYYRQPSNEPARDPRDFKKMPSLVGEFRQATISASDSEWIRGEPPRHIFIDQIPSKQIRTDLNLYAFLEDRFQLSESDIVQINLFPLNQDRNCASVLFSSGYKAWELLRRGNCGTGWDIRIDSDGKEFERIKNEMKREEVLRRERSEMKKEENYYRDRYDIERKKGENYYRDRYDKYSLKSEPLKEGLSCNPFVPCLKVPFSCESSLPFRLDEHVLLSLFPVSRFPSISGVEEGISSWHIHFGREIDVVEADKMFLNDVFVWKNHRFYFEKWKLSKDDVPWIIPEHYNNMSDKKESALTRTMDVDEQIPSQTLPETIEEEDFFMKLPKFIKKRQKLDSDSESSDSGGPINEGISKVKVKKKPLKRQPFVPPPLVKCDPTEAQSGPVETQIDLTDSAVKRRHPKSKETIVIHDEVECQILKSGSAKTEGFFRLTEEEKGRVRFNGILEAFSSSTVVSNQLTNTSIDSGGRSSRVQNRRPILAQPNITMDLFKVSPLQSAQKLVALRNSSIHSYGLIIMESAEPGDLIIEYVGELVRASVANIREWKYEREYCGDGIASSYLFRLDGIMVIDATHQGNLARFINHSCDPNCVAKTINLNGSKRIVMYAKKSIRPGEEITYDYKFPTEKDPNKKVKCLCGTGSCRKYLN